MQVTKPQKHKYTKIGKGLLLHGALVNNQNTRITPNIKTRTGFGPSCNFYVRMHVNFTRLKIEAGNVKKQSSKCARAIKTIPREYWCDCWAIRNIEAIAKALDRQGARFSINHLGDFKIIVGISIVLILTIIPAKVEAMQKIPWLVCMKTMTQKTHNFTFAS